MSKSPHVYQNLLQHSKQASLLTSISQLLEWDQETYMPTEGSTVRAQHLELLASLAHKEKTSKKFGKNLSQLIDLKTGNFQDPNLDAYQKATLREWRRDYLHSVSLPNRFVKELARLCSESMIVWTKARKNNDFETFAPYLSRIIKMSQKKAEYLGYENHPYDALLDLYEPGMTSQVIATLFNELREKIVTLLQNIQTKPQVNDDFLHGEFPKEKQLTFGHILLEAVGYDLKKGRLDLSTHPFSMSLHPHDSRITTRIHKTSLLDCASAVLHEAGHSLYEMGLPVEFFGTPLCEPISLGIHESQSRWWETRIGQSLPFWKYFFPKLKELFKGPLETISIEKFYHGVNKVQPGFIRIEADEVTYSLHVILRFELEKALIEGSLKAKDLPAAWDEKMAKYLGISPKNNMEGCLQDIHWSMGGFGYFPTYTLGNLYASLFFETFEKEYPQWEKRVESGELVFIKEWLNKNIHRYGKFYSANDLAKHVTNQSLSAEPYIKYLTKKYGGIYGF